MADRRADANLLMQFVRSNGVVSQYVQADGRPDSVLRSKVVLTAGSGIDTSAREVCERGSVRRRQDEGRTRWCGWKETKSGDQRIRNFAKN
mmetsp:Transcript_17652/g.37257  ORF Transcript_17652/g.37257 Transcript_17652/m.37257 type:complete len:91 (-) Transcript_17652:261-533(-)